MHFPKGSRLTVKLIQKNNYMQMKIDITKVLSSLLDKPISDLPSIKLLNKLNAEGKIDLACYNKLHYLIISDIKKIYRKAIWDCLRVRDEQWVGVIKKMLPEEKDMIKTGDPLSAMVDGLYDKGFNDCRNQILTKVEEINITNIKE